MGRGVADLRGGLARVGWQRGGGEVLPRGEGGARRDLLCQGLDTRAAMKKAERAVLLVFVIRTCVQ